MEEQSAEEHIKTILPRLDERMRRMFLASCAKYLGRGGLKRVCEISGASPHTVIKGQREIEAGRDEVAPSKQRLAGGGRKKTIEKTPELLEWVKSVVDEATYGTPQRELSWTTKSLDKIHSEILFKYNENIGRDVIRRLLKELGYSLQSNQKMLQIGECHCDRNRQFKFINSEISKALEAKEPVISIDAKKKENIGNFKNNGHEYRLKGNARKVLDHDFPIKELGKVAPYGVYILNNNTGFINLGKSRDTPKFSMDSILAWWTLIGINTFPNAKKLIITCDCGGSNNYRSRVWLFGLQQLANKFNLVIEVHHFPPGTSKWNKIEHRMFAYISKNWRGKPLINIETVVNLIGSTTTKTGLTVRCVVSDNKYHLGVKISDKDYNKINVQRQNFHGEWNYTISPNVDRVIRGEHQAQDE
jgi:transposase